MSSSSPLSAPVLIVEGGYSYTMYGKKRFILGTMEYWHALKMRCDVCLSAVQPDCEWRRKRTTTAVSFVTGFCAFAFVVFPK